MCHTEYRQDILSPHAARPMFFPNSETNRVCFVLMVGLQNVKIDTGTVFALEGTHSLQSSIVIVITCQEFHLPHRVNNSYNYVSLIIVVRVRGDYYLPRRLQIVFFASNLTFSSQIRDFCKILYVYGVKINFRVSFVSFLSLQLSNRSGNRPDIFKNCICKRPILPSRGQSLYRIIMLPMIGEFSRSDTRNCIEIISHRYQYRYMYSSSTPESSKTSKYCLKPQFCIPSAQPIHSPD